MSGVLVAGFGNVLRRDDGFGVAVVRRLQSEPLPAGVRLLEVGIGGLALVQELLAGRQGPQTTRGEPGAPWRRLVVVDAVRRGGAPGTLYLLEPQVPDPAALEPAERQALLTDLHQAEPSRALLLARALGVLPAEVLLLGCEPAECDELGLELTPAVARAVEPAVRRVLALSAAERWDGSGAPQRDSGRVGDSADRLLEGCHADH